MFAPANLARFTFFGAPLALEKSESSLSDQVLGSSPPNDSAEWAEALERADVKGSLLAPWSTVSEKKEPSKKDRTFHYIKVGSAIFCA